MAYDEDLAHRVREAVQDQQGLTEQRMFGGLAFLINGNLAVSASGQGGLLLRVDPARASDLLDPPLVRRFEMRGRELAGWLRIDDEALTGQAEFRHWVDTAVGYARSLPAK
jgi:hypothetical protein